MVLSSDDRRATMAEEVGEAVMIEQWRVGWVVIVDYSKEVMIGANLFPH